MKYRKKPVIVEAVRWFVNGDHPEDESGPVYDGHGVEQPFLTEGKVVRRFRAPDVPGNVECRHCGQTMDKHGWIDTLEGGHRVCPGDWIITGIKGERYPCKPDIFEATYEAVENGG